jgi:Carboxypeptidase regulatory-like domain
MMVRKSLGVLLFTVVMLSLDVQAAEFKLTGHVIDDRTSRGISGLTVSVRPPAKTGARQFVTSTDAAGGFALNRVTAGRYLLEVFQGVTPIDREVIELDRDTAKEVRLGC